MAETLTKPSTNSPDASSDRDRSRSRSSAAQENLQGWERVFIPYECFLGTSATKEQLRRSVAQPVQTALGEPASETSFLDALLGTSMLEPPIERHAAIMSDPRFSHPANAPTSSRIVNRLHQTYGNGHVQRVVDLVQATQDKGLSGEEVSADIEQTIAIRRGTGKPLEHETSPQMESLLGCDFSDVRIHTDRTVDRLPKALQAKAFTMGSDIFFQEEDHEPESEFRRKRVAHKLAHLARRTSSVLAERTDTARVQQLNHSVSRKALQSEPDDPTPERDVIFVLSDDPIMMAEAATLAANGDVFPVTKVEDIVARLKEVTYRIKTVYFVTHATGSNLLIESGSTLTFVDTSTLASTLKGVVPPDRSPNLISFRGCDFGRNPQAMEQIRAALGAGAAQGVACSIVSKDLGPVICDHQRIERPDQVNDDNRACFREGLRDLRKLAGPAEHCIMDTSEAAYFRAGGRYIVAYVSLGGTEWDDMKCKCLKDLLVEKVDPAEVAKGIKEPTVLFECKVIRVEKELSITKSTKAGSKSKATGGVQRAEASGQGAQESKPSAAVQRRPASQAASVNAVQRAPDEKGGKPEPKGAGLLSMRAPDQAQKVKSKGQSLLTLSPELCEELAKKWALTWLIMQKFPKPEEPVLNQLVNALKGKVSDWAPKGQDYLKDPARADEAARLEAVTSVLKQLGKGKPEEKEALSDKEMKEAKEKLSEALTKALDSTKFFTKWKKNIGEKAKEHWPMLAIAGAGLVGGLVAQAAQTGKWENVATLAEQLPSLVDTTIDIDEHWKLVIALKESKPIGKEKGATVIAIKPALGLQYKFDDGKTIELSGTANFRFATETAAPFRMRHETFFGLGGTW